MIKIEKDKNINKKIDIWIKGVEVLFNIIMLLFFYFAFLGDVGKFTSKYYLENGISVYPLFKISFFISGFYFIPNFLLNIFCENKNLKINDLLFCYVFILGNINWFVYTCETKDSRYIYILFILVIVRSIKTGLILVKSKLDLKNKENYL